MILVRLSIIPMPLRNSWVVWSHPRSRTHVLSRFSRRSSFQSTEYHVALLEERFPARMAVHDGRQRTDDTASRSPRPCTTTPAVINSAPAPHGTRSGKSASSPRAVSVARIMTLCRPRRQGVNFQATRAEDHPSPNGPSPARAPAPTQTQDRVNRALQSIARVV